MRKWYLQFRILFFSGISSKWKSRILGLYKYRKKLILINKFDMRILDKGYIIINKKGSRK